MSLHHRATVFQDETARRLQRIVDSTLPTERPVRVLDAGCGVALPVDFPRNVRLVGLDVSPDALSRNQNIDEAILGDIESYPLPEAEYDAVVCWTVLEHLAQPRAALANMAGALKPGGLLIVGVPNLWSLKALVTKATPHAFHIWAYRTVFGYADAGKPGCGPYPTYLRRDMSPARLALAAHEANLEPVFSSTYRAAMPLPRLLAIAWSAVGALGRVVSLGRWDPEASEHAAVFRKSSG